MTVLADDRSGAIETAGEIAASIGRPVLVAPWSLRAEASLPGPAGTEAAFVVDLGSRHLDPVEAGRRARTVAELVANRTAHTRALRAHKIDSTLRGNWAHEIAARFDGERVLVIPALPGRGRTCVDGEVRVHGVPVQHSDSAVDVTGRSWSSRPAEHLVDAFARGEGPGPDRSIVGAMASPVAEHRPDTIAAWLRDPRAAPVAVVDAASDGDLDAIAAIVATHVASTGRGWPLVAGSSAAIAAHVRVLARDPRGPGTQPGPDRRRPRAAGGVILACASRHPAARAQRERLLAADLGIPVVPVVPDGELVTTADRVASDVADRTHAAIRDHPDALLVIVGGDTSAAVLGEHAVEVHGMRSDGAAWGRWRDRTVVVRSGGFGDPDALVRLVRGTLT